MVESMTDQQTDADPYDQLPECIRQYYSRNQYLWLSDEQKARLTESECEPEWT